MGVGGEEWDEGQGHMTTHENQITWGIGEVGRSLAGGRVSLLGHYSCQQVMEELLKAHLPSRILKESAMSLQGA